MDFHSRRLILGFLETPIIHSKGLLRLKGP